MMRIMNVTQTDPTKYKFSHSNDYLNALMCHGEDLPCKDGECITKDDLEHIWRQNLKEHEDIFGNLENVKTLIGFFVKDMITMAKKHLSIQRELMINENNNKFNDNNKNNNNNENEITIAYFSGHDTTLYPLLPIFGFNADDWPPYASHFLIEYIGDSLDELKVRVSFNGIVAKMEVCNNQEYCDLKTFFTHLESFVPNESSCKV